MGMARRPHSHLERPLLCRIIRELKLRLPIEALVFHIPNEDTAGSVAVRVNRTLDGLLPGCPDVEIIHLGGAYFFRGKGLWQTAER